MTKKHFNKNLFMSQKDTKRYQSSSNCWICDQLLVVGNNRIREHCNMTGKYRCSVYWSCNINLKLTEEVSVIFHNLKGYDSHLVIGRIGKFYVKVNVIPNGLKKYISFTIINNLVFISSMQFMSSSLVTLIRKLHDNGFSDLLELAK